MLGLQNEREWLIFCEKVLKNPALAHEEKFALNFKRHENRIELEEIIVNCFSTLTIDQVMSLLESAQIANARMNDMKGLWNHPQLASRERWSSINSPIGPVPALLPPGVNNQYTYRMDTIPDIGEHSELILRELGFDTASIQELREAQAI
jgi:crotonobetainyl-CoA:carnitine CoA-transferase CaiB-like acyl-CoA transferase